MKQLSDGLIVLEANRENCELDDLIWVYDLCLKAKAEGLVVLLKDFSAILLWEYHFCFPVSSFSVARV